MTRLSSEVYGGQERGLAFAQVPDVLAIIAYLHHDALLAAIDREVMACADDKAALTDDEREVRLAEVMGDLLGVEREEVTLIWRAMDEGLPANIPAGLQPARDLVLRPRHAAQRSTARDDGWVQLRFNRAAGRRRR